MAETAKKKAQLHELLAAMGDIQARSDMNQKEGIDTFNKRANHFLGRSKTLKMFDEKDAHLQDANAEYTELTTTVGAKLAYVQKSVSAWYDAFLQKEATNQDARADLVLDEVLIAKDLPAAFFLGMEKELKQLRKLYEEIPTLPPGHKWEKDPALSAADNSKGVYRNAVPEKTLKTQKEIASRVIVPATDHHPAQVETWTENKPVGEFTTELFCGMITAAEKSVMLNRITKLIGAVKKARMRANKAEVRKLAVGKAIFKYIHAADDVDLDDNIE